MRKEVWVLAECSNNQLETTTEEILSEGRRLANKLNGQLCACLLGYELEECIDPIRNYGTEKAYIVDNKILSEYSLDAYSFVLEKLIAKYNPLLLAIGATPLGSELAPRIAARLRLSCITEVKRLSASGENLLIAKSGFNDKVFINFYLLAEKPLIITILPGDMHSDVTSKLSKMEIIREVIRDQSTMIHARNVGFVKGDPRKIRLQEAEFILAAGKGLDNKGLASLKELADILGASIGGTRPLVDDGVITFERQIGITGKSVAPYLLITCGISGAREFTMGIEKTKLTIAINNDGKAPIFNVADLGVLGDVNQIIPSIVHVLKSMKDSTKGYYET
jgi:electron transfer flavoprotein alpha subunit